MASEAKPYNPEVFQAVRESYSPGEEHRIYETDVTLRDLFAAAALLVSGSRGLGPILLAHDAYVLADAMLVEREKMEK